MLLRTSRTMSWVTPMAPTRLLGVIDPRGDGGACQHGVTEVARHRDPKAGEVGMSGVVQVGQRVAVEACHATGVAADQPNGSARPVPASRPGGRPGGR
jgi:hypothetical protein